MHPSKPINRIFSSLGFQVIAFFLGVITVLELVARTPWVYQAVSFHSTGNYHSQFEVKWYRLDNFVKQNGGVDVIILGSSLVNTGIDPFTMGLQYYERTGKNLRIFNFGVEGLTIAPNSVNASILVRKYHPALLIFVTEMRDFIATNGLDVQQRFLSDPWMEYQQGSFNFTGWMIDHSMALQTFLPYKNWMRADFPQTISSFMLHRITISTDGYERENYQGGNIDSPPDPANPQDAQNFLDYGNFQVAPSRLGSLQSILSLQGSPGTKVLIVEMPVHPSFYVFIGGDSVHKQFQGTISSFVTSSGSIFLPAETCGSIPLAGRADRVHLNNLGAHFFSVCLGDQLSNLAQDLDLSSINMTTNNTR
jgi:hypothetical protein